MNYIDAIHLFDLPCHVFLKDTKGVYLSCNPLVAKNSGFANQDDLIGATDYDLPWKDSASLLQTHDQKVLSTKSPLTFIEGGTLISNDYIRTLSYKSPIFARCGKLTGVFGISFLLDGENSVEILNQSIARIGETILCNEVNNIISNPHRLSNRQIECLCYLVKGMTARQTALKLGLSKRTVEHYLEEIKNKLNCKLRSELIEKALQMPVIRDRIF